MKQEILFRGKSINSNEWIESMTVAKGTIKRKRDCVYLSIGDNVWRGVKPETVGQFIGLHDKNGKKAFLDDIVKTANGEIFKIEWSMYFSSYFLSNKEKCLNIGANCSIAMSEIIGNIHDNPRFLEAAN